MWSTSTFFAFVRLQVFPRTQKTLDALLDHSNSTNNSYWLFGMWIISRSYVEIPSKAFGIAQARFPALFPAHSVSPILNFKFSKSLHLTSHCESWWVVWYIHSFIIRRTNYSTSWVLSSLIFQTASILFPLHRLHTNRCISPRVV